VRVRERGSEGERLFGEWVKLPLSRWSPCDH